MAFFSKEPNSLFGLFSMAHLMILISTVVLVVGILVFQQKLYKWKSKDKFRVSLGMFILTLDIGFYIWKYSVGLQPMFPIPMHICSWATYIVGIALITNNKLFVNVGIYYGFTGGLLSLLVPDFGGYGIDHFRFYQFFILHIILLIGPLFLVFAYDSIVEKKYLYYTIVIMSLQAVLAFPINRLVTNKTGIETNMMFVMEPPAEIASILPGSPYHIFIVAIVFIALWFGFYSTLKKKHL